MRAARIHEYGDASVIRVEVIPRPTPRSDEVLIDVAATSFNPTVEPPRAAPLTAMHMVARNDTVHLAALVKLVGAGVVAVEVAESHPLADLVVVHGSSEVGSTRGKITILP
jgi:hypothetical protein